MHRLLFCILFISVAALNVTHFPPPPKKGQTRALDQQQHFLLSFSCPVSWTAIDNVYQELTFLFNGCYLSKAGQGHRTSALRVTCLYDVNATAVAPGLLEAVRDLLLATDASTELCTSGAFYGITVDKRVQVKQLLSSPSDSPPPSPVPYPPTLVPVPENSPSTEENSPSPTPVPVHTQPSALWHLDRVDQRHLPLDSAYRYVHQGTGVTVYVIDTGIRTDHVEFEGRASMVLDLVDPPYPGDANGTSSVFAFFLKFLNLTKVLQVTELFVPRWSVAGRTEWRKMSPWTASVFLTPKAMVTCPTSSLPSPLSWTPKLNTRTLPLYPCP
jgi:hypothetical protein